VTIEGVLACWRDSHKILPVGAEKKGKRWFEVGVRT